MIIASIEYNTTYSNNVRIIYSTDFFETYEDMDYDILNFFPAKENIVLLRMVNNKKVLSLGHYENQIFTYEDIDIDSNIDDLNAIILLHDNISSKIFYIMFDNISYGHLFITSNRDTIWRKSIENILNSIHMNEFLIDFHKVYLF